MKTGIELIWAERQEQNFKHGRTIEHDVKVNTTKELAYFAALLLSVEWEEVIDPDSYPDGWDTNLCYHMISKPYKERLIIAGALIAAEIDRLNNQDK